MKTVAVFFGGQSVEHDISVITGVMSANSLDKNKFCGVPVYVGKNGDWYSGKDLLDLDIYKNLDYKKLQKVTLIGGDNALYQVKGKKLKKLCEIAVAVNCMHGERGEDGSLAGLLSMCKIPLASPSQMPSAVCMDKTFTKTTMKAIGIKTLKGITVKSIDEITQAQKSLNFPLIIKPNKSGSSIGVSRADTEDQLLSGVNYALKFGESALIEPCLNDFVEINCACYKNAAGVLCVSECERPVGRTEILSFNDKYEGGKRVFPADIDQKIADKIKAITAKIYQKLGFSGVIRIDFFVVGKEIILNEINTVPGSLAYYLFGDTLNSLTLMLSELINRALSEYARAINVQTDYKSGVLTLGGTKGAKKQKGSDPSKYKKD